MSLAIAAVDQCRQTTRCGRWRMSVIRKAKFRGRRASLVCALRITGRGRSARQLCLWRALSLARKKYCGAVRTLVDTHAVPKRRRRRRIHLLLVQTDDRRVPAFVIKTIGIPRQLICNETHACVAAVTERLVVARAAPAKPHACDSRHHATCATGYFEIASDLQWAVQLRIDFKRTVTDR